MIGLETDLVYSYSLRIYGALSLQGRMHLQRKTVGISRAGQNICRTYSSQNQRC